MKRPPPARQVLLLGALLLACPGRIDDPTPFLVHCPPGFNVETDLFQSTTTCGNMACHNPMTLAGGLDLVSPNPAARLINHPSSGCSGFILISSPDSGLLFDKLNGTQTCGSRMPQGKAPLTADDILCVTQWVIAHLDGGGGP